MVSCMAYQTFIVREARKCGKGWQEYDLMFRQQQASAVDIKWNSVSSALYTVTFGAPAALSGAVQSDIGRGT